jgi:hypothetical protein
MRRAAASKLAATQSGSKLPHSKERRRSLPTHMNAASFEPKRYSSVQHLPGDKLLRMGAASRSLPLFLFVMPSMLAAQSVPQDAVARGHQILEQAIQALGGQAYLSLRDYRAEGRAFSFDRWEEINGMAPITNFQRLPDKSRQVQGKKHDVIMVINGDKGWDSTYRGVAELPATEIERNQLSRKLSFDVILRLRLKEPGVELLFTGTDFVDGQPVDVVEFSDADANVAKLGIAHETHLPVRREWERKLPNHVREQNVETLGKYHVAKGSTVQFPFYVRRERNGIKVFEAFFEEIDATHRLDDSLFERPAGKERVDVPSRKGGK